MSVPANVKRIVYKTPYNLFFRRLWLVKKAVPEGDSLRVEHGLRGRRVTFLPLCKGETMVTFVTRKGR